MIELLSLHEIMVRFVDAVLIMLNVLAWIAADLQNRPEVSKSPPPSSGQKPKINMWYEVKTTPVTTRDIRQDAKG